jgi:hypothetical protein
MITQIHRLRSHHPFGHHGMMIAIPASIALWAVISLVVF